MRAYFRRKYYGWRARIAHRRTLVAIDKDNDKNWRKYGAQLTYFKRRELGVVAKRK